MKTLTRPSATDKSKKGMNLLAKGLKTVTNTYVHSDSIIKKECRTEILANVKEMFPNVETLNTFTLGGEHLMTEKMLLEHYKLNGVSYEFDKPTFERAKQNAPKGIKIVKGNIFNHQYKGNEHFIWFDFMTSLRYENIQQLLNWIAKNPISNDCVFVATYCLHSRSTKGEGYRQLFKTDEEHNAFINEQANYIGLYLENDKVRIEGKPTVIKYCNTDISNMSLPMVQFIFNVKKK